MQELNVSVFNAKVVASKEAAVTSAGWRWPPLQRGSRLKTSSPLLEQPHPLAPAVRAPEVATAGRGMTAVSRAMIAVAPSTDTGAPENVDQRRSSEITSLKTSLSSCLNKK